MAPVAQPICQQGLPVGTQDQACVAIAARPFSCYDYMTITAWGEGYLTLRLVNGWLDKCGKILDPHLLQTIGDIVREAKSPTGMPRKLVDTTKFFIAESGSDNQTCINVHKDSLPDCLNCYFSEYARNSVPLRHTRQSKHWWHRLRRKLAICHNAGD